MITRGNVRRKRHRLVRKRVFKQRRFIWRCWEHRAPIMLEYLKQILSSGGCPWLIKTFDSNASKENRQAHGGKAWFAASFKYKHNQIAAPRQAGKGEESIRRLRCRANACSAGWFELTARINAIQWFPFRLWLFRLRLIIPTVFSNLSGEVESGFPVLSFPIVKENCWFQFNAWRRKNWGNKATFWPSTSEEISSDHLLSG